MKRRILIFACEAPPDRNNFVSGGSLRIWSIAEGLRHCGHEVLFYIPEEVAKKLPKDSQYRETCFNIKNLDTVVTKINPELIIFEQWGIASYLENANIPVMFDLHGSLVMENLYRNHRNFTSNATAKIKTLSKADYIICAGERQKRYFLAWFMMAGFNAADQNERISVLPVSFPPFEKHSSEPAHQLRFVFGGQMWPWIDPFPGLDIVADFVEKTPDTVLDMFVGKPKLTKVLPKDSTFIQINQSYQRLKKRNGVEWHELVGRNELIQHYLKSSVAYDVYQPNFERDLAFTTRTVEYLWCGLPVIYSDYQELSHYISEYDAGFIVNPSDEDSIRQILEAIRANPDMLAEKSFNARRLAEEKFNIFNTIHVIESILDSPSLRKREKSLLDNISYKEEALEAAHEMMKMKDEEIKKMHAISFEKDEEIIAEQNKNAELRSEIETLKQEIECLKGKVNKFQYMYSCVKHDAIMYREQKKSFLFKYFGRFATKLKRICFQYPMLLLLFIGNFYINSQMNDWIKRNSRKIFLGQ